MKRLLLALAFLIAQAIAPQAWYSIGGGELQGYWVGGSLVPTLSFLQCTENTANAASWTFTAENVGTASATRATIVGVLVRDNATIHDTTAVSVGGAAATQVVDEGGTGASTASLWIVSNPAGTAEDIIVTHSESALTAIICTWAAYDLSSTTAVASTDDDEASPGTNPVVLDLTTSADGIAVGVCTLNDSGQTATWTGLTEQGAEVGSDGQGSAAHAIPTNGSSLAITCNWTGAVSEAGVAAAFR